MTQSPAVDFEILRASILLESDPAAAARSARAILASAPGRSEAYLLLAAACRRLGDPGAATTALESLPQPLLDSPVMQLELGRAYAACGRASDALAALHRAVGLDPGLADGWCELAAQLFLAGETLQGDAAYAEYLRLTKIPAELSDAMVALADSRLDAAEQLLRGRLEQAQNDVVARRMLAEVATRREEHEKAAALLTQCLEIAPGYAAARYDLARALTLLERSEEALPLIERLLATQPHHIEFLSLKAQALRLIGRNDDALALMEQVVARHPNEDGAWLLYGHLLRELGEQGRAIAAYRHALQSRPTSGGAHWSLANLKTFRFAEAELAAMRERLGEGSVRGADRVQLEFALGKALEDEGQFAASFEHYARGNALHRATIVHAPDATTADVQRSKVIYNTRFFAERSDWGSQRSDPIFIVGLPRSGSTLLEQILASHSQVEGTRELQRIPALARALLSRAQPSAPLAYPEPVATLTRQEIEVLAADYLSQAQTHRALGKPRFVDKMLSNFGHVGLLQLMFPRAAIIDARRHPLGCGLSCFKQLFARGHSFSYDLAEIGRHYRDYVELMEHFDAVLPGRVHRVFYEHLVADPEREVRRLLEYCGLQFESRCLRFHENPRVVQTISSEQVRRPIYAQSVDHWRHYEPWLTPLKDALGDLAVRYPSPVPPRA